MATWLMVASVYVVQNLTEHFGAEVAHDGPASLVSGSARLLELLHQYRLLLLRGMPTDAALQIEFTRALGRPVRQKGKAGPVFSSSLPELRVQSNAVDPETRRSRFDTYSQYWHSDHSWARNPADLTLLLAVDAGPGAYRTGIADAVYGYSRLSHEYAKRIANWRAYHHVKRSRRLRYGGATPGESPPVSADSEGGARFLLTQCARSLLGYPVAKLFAVPVEGGPLGAVHRVVQKDRWSGRPFVYLGDHAWSIPGMDADEGLMEIDRLNAAITADEQVYYHGWQPGDLLVFKNRLMLHRSETVGDSAAARVLRRTTAWLR